MAALRISSLEERHLTEVVTIENAAQTCPWSEQSFRNELAQDHGIFIVGELGQELIGFAGQWIMIDEAHIITVAIKDSYRRQGHAETLINELLLRAKDQGATCATLEVRAGNAPAIALYEKLGFQTTGKRKNYYPDNKEDALIMWLYDLKSWTPPKS
ncbi:ribosomal-protein-alanine N-acetyltransferase [bacterium]|jgi:[ribosomal protein S18]-alanine N-acetyltransferase|nr:ribosomal-protein-alanine N-acetyltransferase [bacterium]